MVDENGYLQVFGDIANAVAKKLQGIYGLDDQLKVSIAIMQEMAKDRRMNEIDARMRSPEAQKKLVKSWRDDPATPEQIKAMQDLHIEASEHITKGQASDRINEKIKKIQASK